MTPPESSEDSPRVTGWSLLVLVLAVVWVLAFLACYFRIDLAHGELPNRTQVLLYADTLLAELLLPRGEPGQKVGWGYLAQRLDLAWVAALIMTASWSLGRLVLRGLKLFSILTRAENFVFACGVGLSLWSLLTLGCGLLGMMSRSVHLAMILTAMLLEAVCWWRQRRADPAILLVESSRQLPGDHETGLIESMRFWRRMTIAACVPFLFCIVFGGLLPQVDFDTKEYHFGGPKEWFQNGRMTFLPHNVYTSFPFLTEMFILAGMILKQDWFWGAISGNGVLLCFAPLTALGLYSAGKRWFSEPAGLLAAWLYLCTPWVFRISNIPYTEGALCFYLFAAFSATLLAWDRRAVAPAASAPDNTTSFSSTNTTNTQSTSSLPLLAGLLAGSAMACKYPGVLSVVLPLGALMLIGPWLGRWISTRSEPTPSGTVADKKVFSGRAACMFSLGVAITVGPWLIKNLAQTGNPVYPLLYKVFGGLDWDAELDAKFKHGHSPNHYDLSKMIWWVHEDLVEVLGRHDWQSPLLFSLAPLAFLNGINRRRTLLLWGYVSYLFLTWWFFTHRIDRFWLPLLPLAALLAGIGGTWVLGSGSKRPPGKLTRRVWMGFVLATCLSLGLFLLAYIGGNPGLCGYNPFFQDLEQVAANTARITSPEIVELNQHLPPGSKVLCVGEAEIFDARFPLVYNTVFDKSIFEEWCGESDRSLTSAARPLKPAAEIRRKLTEQGITHIYVNWLEILRYRTSYGYTDFVTPQKFAELQRLGILEPAWNTPGGYQAWDDVQPGNRAEIERWGPTLRRKYPEGDRLRTFEVFPVRK